MKGGKHIANLRKFSNMTDIGHLCKHYERSVSNDNYSNKDIDKSRLKEDSTNLAPFREKQTDYIKQQIDIIMNGRTLRKDAVRMCCWIIDAPMQLQENMKQRFFEESYSFLVDRYGSKSGMGEDVVISSYIHKSETTDHMHFAFLPIVERNGIKSFCAKECINREDLKTFHKDFAIHMEKLGICKESDILNGNTIRDTNGRALTVRELKKQRDVEYERIHSRWNRPHNKSHSIVRERGRW